MNGVVGVHLAEEWILPFHERTKTKSQKGLGCIHLLNTRKYCDNTRKYYGNTHEYCHNTCKFWSNFEEFFYKNQF